MEILTGELLVVVFVAAAVVVVWSYLLFLLVAPPESSGLELLPRPLRIGDGHAQPSQCGFELAQTSVPPLEAPAQNAPAVATAQNGQAARAYVTQSSHGTWLFPPHQGGNG